MKKKLMVLSGFVLGLAPVVALAQVTQQLTQAQQDLLDAAAATKKVCVAGELGGIMCKVSGLVSAVLPILIALGVLYFVWGVVSFVIADEEEAKTKGRDRIIYGIIGLTVIVAMWGLVGILNTTFGLSTETTKVNFPGVPGL